MFNTFWLHTGWQNDFVIRWSVSGERHAMWINCNSEYANLESQRMSVGLTMSDMKIIEFVCRRLIALALENLLRCSIHLPQSSQSHPYTYQHVCLNQTKTNHPNRYQDTHTNGNFTSTQEAVFEGCTRTFLRHSSVIVATPWLSQTRKNSRTRNLNGQSCSGLCGEVGWAAIFSTRDKSQTPDLETPSHGRQWKTIDGFGIEG